MENERLDMIQHIVQLYTEIPAEHMDAFRMGVMMGMMYQRKAAEKQQQATA